MDTPFNLSFCTNTGNVLNVTKFAESHKELIEGAENFSIEVKENCDLTVLFENRETERLDWTLEIDILDGLPERCFTDEELQIQEKTFFYPSDMKRPLYLDSRSTIEGPENVIYPMLIPGSYKIVVSNSKKKYFSFLKVISLRIDDDQLDIMRKEIESYLKGLSLSVNRNSNMNLYKYESTNNILYKTSLFVENYSRIIGAFNRITNNPKYCITRIYSINEISKAGKIDSQTIRFKQKRMDMHDKLLTHKNTIDYNIKENQMLKYIVYSLKVEVQNCLQFVDEKIKRDRVEIEEKRKYLKNEQRKVMASSLVNELKYNDDIYNKLSMILNICNKYLTEKWIEFVDEIRYIKQPTLLARSQNYSEIYKFYLQIKSQMNIDNHPLINYNYYWKESSKLYEIWGFLKLKEFIEHSDFDLKPTEGWIYDKELEMIPEVIPFLDPNTRIIYENDKGIKLVLYYDSELLLEEETSIENPVFTVESHNRPDFRIDIYKFDIYKKSIIGDFKYRDHSSLGNINSYLRGNTSAYKQLLAYSKIRTMYINSEKKNKRSKEAAYEAWVFYPERIDINPNRRSPFDSATNIRRIELSPGKTGSIEGLSDTVNETIKSIIDDED